MMATLLLLLVWLALASPLLALQTGRCDGALGMQSGDIPDDHITASSYFDAAVNAIYGRAHVEAGGGAWCPRDMIHNEGAEFLEVNLGGLHIVTKVEVQGRFGNGQGREYARTYKLQFWRPGLNHWVTYKDGHGKELLEGNSNTYLAQSSQLSPPIITARVRFVPYGNQPRTVCMRVEVFGCPYTDGIVSYSMPDGDLRGNDAALHDLTYDGTRKDGWLTNGLGQLTDGETGHTNFRVDALGRARGYEWIGWKNDTRATRPVELTFAFDSIRNFSAVHIYTNNFFTKDTQVFSHARISFSVGGEYFGSALDYEYVVDRIFDNARNVTINLHRTPAKYVRIQLYFALRWILISEVAFDSVSCHCNMTSEERPMVTSTEASAEEEENGMEARSPVVPSRDAPSLVILVVLVAVGVVAVVVVVLGVLYYRARLARKTQKKSPKCVDSEVDARKVSMKMKDLHINVNLSPMANGYSRAKGKLYGHVAMEEETHAMYQEPYLGPLHNPGYYTLGHTTSPSETVLKCPLSDADDSVDYAVPDVNMTPPPPFSEVYTPPPPIPLSRPPSSLPTSRPQAPVPTIPPPPKEEYYSSTNLCQPCFPQGIVGTITYASPDASPMIKGMSSPEVPRTHIRVVETLGEGVFGAVKLCDVGSRRVAMKCLKGGASEDTKVEFRREGQVLDHVDDPNIVRVLGVVDKSEPLCLLLEYPEHGDLYQFLRRHRVEGTTAPPGTDVPELSYGALVYVAAQVASGMKHLEGIGLVHRDLAARNCLVGRGITVKISDFAMSQQRYQRDYYRPGGTGLLPVRWMSWEALLQGQFSSKSDVWSFGVTLWEILTMARQQPYDELNNDEVLENLSNCYHGDGSAMMMLPHPPICPREMYDMILACWRPNLHQRPPFWEILMFLQRKNLGYKLDYRD